MYVAQRVGEIQELTNISEWRYVPSKLNAADEATKRTKETDFSPSSRWINGPDFLQNYPCKWPEEELKNSIQENSEEKAEYVLVHTVGRKEQEKLNFETPEPKRFSIWNRLLRTTSWMLRIAQNLKEPDTGSRVFNELEVWEITRAEHLLLKRSQVESFYEEMILHLTENRLFHSLVVYNNYHA